MRERPTGTRKIATLKDVAREAGVSIAAVSYSLNGGGSIGEEVRARVREVAERMGYRPNRSARAVRTGRSMTLGLVVPDLNNPYYPALAQSFERAARQAGYTVVLIDTSGSEEEEVEGIRHLENHGVAGAVWCQTAHQPSEVGAGAGGGQHVEQVFRRKGSLAHGGGDLRANVVCAAHADVGAQIEEPPRLGGVVQTAARLGWLWARS